MALVYDTARKELARVFRLAEADIADGTPPVVSGASAAACDEMFASKTQSIREALLGCALARHLDRHIDIQLPYMNLGNGAFNGRTLDESVVNPFLRAKHVPSSKGPYLASFRRSVSFNEETTKGLKDKTAYAAMLAYIGELKAAESEEHVEGLLRYLLYRFVRLRDASIVTLSRINRLSVPQFRRLIDEMLRSRSGGRFPVFLSTAMLETIKRTFSLPWSIEQQGINAADAASKVGGDIDVRDTATERLIFSIEVTERVIDRNRVEATFATKISPYRIEDYLFFHSTSLPDSGALEAARQYFAQGHDISFVDVAEWLVNCLVIVGSSGRALFTDTFVDLLAQPDVPSEIKVRWNNLIKNLHNASADEAEI